MKKMILSALFLSLAVPSLAFAQDADEPAPQDDDMIKEKRGLSTDNDPVPKAPRPVIGTVDGKPVEDQAGIGSTIAYSEAGVLELGGSAGFSRAGDLTTASFNPSIGWFFADNIQLSGILGFQYTSVAGVDGSTFTGLIEPSYHLPFTDQVFGFAGVGAGVQYAQGAGTGFAVVPRFGANLLVGRSGIFTPAINVGYSTVEATGVGNNSTILTVEPSFGVSAGYTVMW